MLSVHDTMGHTFMQNNSEDSETCLTCGGTWRFVDVTDPEFPASVDRTYEASSGDAPEYCSSDTGRVHGEAPCENNNGTECPEASEAADGLCVHTRHDCNCLYCA